MVPENTRIFQGAVGIQKTVKLSKFHLLVSLEGIYADWNLKRKMAKRRQLLLIETSVQKCFGVNPEIGFRVLVGNKIFFDILPGYLAYFGDKEEDFAWLFNWPPQGAFEF